uniref:Uncharacterized protein n=1 Tax=Arundo donax TaxID=35708 RepID=A0A0A9ACD0_ARUDO
MENSESTCTLDIHCSRTHRSTPTHVQQTSTIFYSSPSHAILTLFSLFFLF